MKFNLIYLLLILSILSPSCEEKNDNDISDTPYEVIDPVNPQQKGDRLLGIAISKSVNGFESAFNKALKAGIQTQELNIPWTEIETSQGQYTDPYGDILAATNYYGTNNIQVGLSLAVINTVKWEVPDYLDENNCNSQEFINAFVKMANWSLSSIPENVTISHVSIGNEVDLVLESDKEWQKYTEFYEAVLDSLKPQYPNIKFGIKTTIMDGVFTNELAKIQRINQNSDVVMLNYYPQDESFQVLKPDIVKTHFSDVSKDFTGQEIWFTEIGYQSGTNHCNSSEEKQAEFFHHMFTAWDSHKDQIKYMMINWLHEQSPAVIDEWKDYYGDDPALMEYLSTLGLRNYDDTDKAAWKQLLEEANSRGWKK